MTERKQIFKQVGTALAVGTLLSFIGEFIYGIILGLNPEWMTNGTIVLMLSSISIWITKYPVAAWMMRKLPSAKNKKVHLSGKEFISCIFLIFAAMYVFNWLGAGIYSVFRKIIGKEAISLVAEMLNETNYVGIFIFIVIGAPVIEELFFRKLLIDKTLACGKKTAVLASALIFALVHGNFQQSLYTFFMGLLLAFLYVKTANIVYPILLHMIINFFGGFLSKYMVEQLPIDIMQATEKEIAAALMTNGGDFIGFLLYVAIVVVFTLIGVVLWIKNRKKFKLEEERKPEENKENSLKVIMANPGMILFSGFYIFMILLLLVI